MGSRRTVAVACVALVVFAAFLPLGGFEVEWLALPSGFVLLPPHTLSAVHVEAPQAHPRGVPLAADLDVRGPPPPLSHE